MRTSRLLLATLKETPADAEIISHQLMLRAGMVRKLAAGLYTWLPLGLRVLRKVEAIVREEMNHAGAQEVLMPAVQPAELWQESGRWEQYGPELLRLQDRHKRDFCFGPTHEEIITDLIRREIRSYRQLPANFYQIQTKFRDEVRPRFGIMRAREFLMKDAYSFHLSPECLQTTYDEMYQTYNRIFHRLGLKFRAVLADNGSIGGNSSHEFHVLAESGEDAIAYSNSSDYAANVELAPTLPSTKARNKPKSPSLAVVNTPEQHTIEAVSHFLNVSPAQCLKTLIVESSAGGIIALVLRGDHTLNAIKTEKIPEIKSPLTMADPERIKEQIGCDIGSLGPVGLTIPILADYAAVQVADFVCGANKEEQHLVGVNWSIDLPEPKTADLRNIQAGDPSPDGQGIINIARGIEVGHVFQLGQKYSAAMEAKVLNESGENITLYMGCYGIGVSRIVAAAIEQNHDAKGIIWPQNIAPFSVVLLPMNMHKSDRLPNVIESLYQKLLAAGIDVLFDDRKERPGVMFADMELIGIPHRIVIGDRGLDKGIVEYRHRRDSESQEIPFDEIIDFLKERLNSN